MDKTPFSTEQSKFYDDSPCVLITASRGVLHGRIVKHLSRNDPPRWLIVVEIPRNRPPASDGGKPAKPKDAATLLLDNVG